MIEPLLTAFKEWGNREFAGTMQNPDIVKYFQDIGYKAIKDDETAWCAAFVSWCLKHSNREWHTWAGVRQFLNYGTETKTPELGDLVIIWKVTPYKVYSHIGFFVRKIGGAIYVLGGNQDDQVNIQLIPEWQVLSYRKIPLPA